MCPLQYDSKHLLPAAHVLLATTPQSHCWLNVLSGGVEELRFTTGDTPVGAEPAIAPRLPGKQTAPLPRVHSACACRLAQHIQLACPLRCKCIA